MAKIKICGLKRNADIEYVNQLMPDYIGFILSNGFKRSVDKKTAEALKSVLNENIKAVGVFVDEPLEKVLSISFVDFVQLHGNESPEYCAKIDKPVIKMLSQKDFNIINEYEPYVDYFLFDSGCGTGNAFDWDLIPETNKPFFLAGGLTADNLKEAINRVKPYAVDLSSSVETGGVKDFNKIKEVINIVRSFTND